MEFKKILTLVFGVLVSLISWAQAPSQQLSNVLQNFNSMQANFQQISMDSYGKVLQKSNGTMALQRPGKFRWQTTSPNQQLILADGSNIWVYDVNLQQATKQNQNQSAHSSNPAALLSGSIASLQQQFLVSESRRNNGVQAFVLKPLNKKGIFESIELVFRQGVLQQMHMKDNLGQNSVFTFSQIQMNPSLNPTLFQFNPPKGTDIISQ